MQHNNATVPDWALMQSKPGAIRCPEIPRQYRFDGESGRFLIGEIELGDTISARIFDRRVIKAARWGRPVQTWIDLAFIDGDGVVSVLSLKKESAINLVEFFLTELNETQATSINPLAVQVELVANTRSHDDGDYWVVETGKWKFVEEADFKALLAFVTSDQFQWIFLGEDGDE